MAGHPWRQFVEDWYPNWRQQSYFVPPIFMRKVPYVQTEVAGQSVRVPQPPVTQAIHFGKGEGKAPVLESDVREDQAQNHVLCCLKALGDHHQEVMFVLSQLNFSDYLNQPSYAPAAALLPRPIDLRTKGNSAGHGDFDLVVIHRHCGLLVAEVKSFGSAFDSLAPDHFRPALAKKIKMGVRQLDKSEVVLKHLVSDFHPPPRVSKTLALPNVTSAQIRSVLSEDPSLLQVQ